MYVWSWQAQSLKNRINHLTQSCLIWILVCVCPCIWSSRKLKQSLHFSVGTSSCVSYIAFLPGEWLSVEMPTPSTDTPSRRSASWNISSGSSTRASFRHPTPILFSLKEVKKKKKMLWRNSYEMQLWIRDRHDTQLITCCATERFFFFYETEQQFQSRWVTVLSPLSCHASSSSVWALLPTSNPDVWELLRLTTELEHFSPCRWPSSSIEAISVEMLCCRASASIPELLVECRDRPGLLSEPWWSMSRSSLMYDSL